MIKCIFKNRVFKSHTLDLESKHRQSVFPINSLAETCQLNLALILVLGDLGLLLTLKASSRGKTFLYTYKLTTQPLSQTMWDNHNTNPNRPLLRGRTWVQVCKKNMMLKETRLKACLELRLRSLKAILTLKKSVWRKKKLI